MTVHLLIVDDDDIFRSRLARALTNQGVTVGAAADANEALRLAKARQSTPDAFTHALVDLRMPGESGLVLVSKLSAEYPEIDVSVLTGFGSIDTALDAVRRGAKHYLQKPITARAVMAQLFGGRQAEHLETGDDAAERADSDVPSLARNEWEYIQRVLHECDNNVSLAARRLGLHRRTLQRKLSKFPPEK